MILLCLNVIYYHLNDNYCISMFNYRGKYEECEEYTKYNENSSMENFNLDCLDQLILVVHLPDVSVTNTNDCFYLL